MSSPLECPKCWRTRWHATGRRNHNRHGMLRAELVCESCSYVFSSGRPEALTAAEGVTAADVALPEPVPSLAPQPSIPGTRVSQPSSFTKVGSLMTDFRKKQAGEDVA